MGMAYSSKFNLESLKQNLFAKKGRVNSEMKAAVEAGAEQIMAKSQSNSPVDTYNLEQAHHIKKTFTNADNIRFSVEVSGVGYGSDEPRNVDTYALVVHESYDISRMGPRSIAKKAEGHDVGPFYLDRAIESEKPSVLAKVKEAVRRATRNK